MTEQPQVTTNPTFGANFFRRNNDDGQEDDLLSQNNLVAAEDGDSSHQAQDNQEPDTPVKYTSQLAALFIIINLTVGVGLLAMPAAIQEAGIVTSLLMQAIFLIIIMNTCVMCTELTVQTGVDSYHRMVEVHCHKLIYQLSQAAILLIVFGTAVALIVTIGDQSDRLFASIYGPTFCYSWYLNRRFIMCFLTVFVIKPLCAAKTVDFLKYASFLGVVSVGFIMYVVASEFKKIDKIPESVKYFPNSIDDLSAVLPVFCLAYQCHLSWVPTVASIKREEKRKAFVTISISMVLVTIIYVIVSVLAVLSFGSNIADDLTESYKGNSWPVLTTIGVVAFKCVVSIPPTFLALRLSLVDILKKSSKFFADRNEVFQRVSVTYVTLMFALLMALFVPDILLAVNILGCISVVFVFTLPAICYLNLIKVNRVTKQQMAGEGDVPIYSTKDKLKISLSYFIAAFGIIMTVVVLYKSTLSAIETGKTIQPLCHKV